MKNFLIILTIICFLPLFSACQTVTNKIDEKSTKEEKELSKWLNQTETDLKIEFGKPDRIEFLDTRNRYYVYVTKKLNIKCERKFEINSNNIVVGFSSKNCF
jgi:hypothetical protein